MKANKISTITKLFEGSEVTTKCSQLKMIALDGKIILRDRRYL